MRHLTYIYNPLSRFKLLIVDDIHYHPSSTQNVFPTFSYDSTYAWRKNSVVYIIKFHISSLIFLMGGSSNSTFSRDYVHHHGSFAPPDIITSCNVPPSTFVVFQYATIFSFSLFS